MYKDKYSNIKSNCIKKSNIESDIVISILIPTYNRAKYVEEAIDSAVNQLNSNINHEIIVVNDDPSDLMQDLVEKYKDIDNISFYNNEDNIGMGGNFNRCVLLAKGKYVAYLHDDDMLKTNYMVEIEKFLSKYSDQEIGSIVINRDYLYMKNQYTIVNQLKKKALRCLKKCINILFLFRFIYRKDIEILTPEKMLLGWTKNFYLAPSCGSLFHREKIMEFGLYNEDLYPAFDYVLFLQMNHKYKTLLIRKKLGIYRWDENVSTQLEAKIKTCMIKLKIIDTTFENTRLNKFFGKYRDVLKYLEINRYTEQEKNEIILRVKEDIVKPAKFKIIKYKIVNYSYKIIHNLDY